MKKTVFTLLGLLVMASFGFAQTTYVDFEETHPTGYPFGGNTYEPGVENPLEEGNTSANVGFASTGGETWSGMAMPLGGTIAFTEADTTFTMDVYSEATGEIVFKLENASNTDIAVETSNDYETSGEWTTLEFNFPEAEAETYSQIVLFFNFGTSDSTGWYFDNIQGPELTTGGDVTVNFNVDDKLGIANSVTLLIEEEALSLTESETDLWTGSKALAPYNIIDGGGEYEVIVQANEENKDTTMLTVSGGQETMDWNYLLLDEEPEDGTAKAISVGDTPPVIDGDVDDVWDNAKAHPLQKRDWWGTPTGLYSYYKIMWDIDNVYIMNYVEDATPYNDGGDPWLNDNVELFFDMNQSASAGYDSDDYQIRHIRDSAAWTGSEGIDAIADASEKAQSSMENNEGYIVEWAIPWSALSDAFLPVADEAFNFDITVADNADSASAREYIIAWNTTADQNYNNTELFGTVTLSDETDQTTGIFTEKEQLEVSVYPNPAENFLYINKAQNVNRVEISNLLGAEVKAADLNGSAKEVVDISGLKSGIYIVTVQDKAGKTASFKLLKK